MWVKAWDWCCHSSRRNFVEADIHQLLKLSTLKLKYSINDNSVPGIKHTRICQRISIFLLACVSLSSSTCCMRQVCSSACGRLAPKSAKSVRQAVGGKTTLFLRAVVTMMMNIYCCVMQSILF